MKPLQASSPPLSPLPPPRFPSRKQNSNPPSCSPPTKKRGFSLRFFSSFPSFLPSSLSASPRCTRLRNEDITGRNFGGLQRGFHRRAKSTRDINIGGFGPTYESEMEMTLCLFQR